MHFNAIGYCSNNNIKNNKSDTNAEEADAEPINLQFNDGIQLSKYIKASLSRTEFTQIWVNLHRKDQDKLLNREEFTKIRINTHINNHSNSILLLMIIFISVYYVIWALIYFTKEVIHATSKKNIFIVYICCISIFLCLISALFVNFYNRQDHLSNNMEEHNIVYPPTEETSCTLLSNAECEPLIKGNLVSN